MSTEAPAKTNAPASPAAKPGGSYEVARPHGVCSVCGEAIAPESKYMAALRETAEGFERLNVSLGCWEKLDRANVVAFWKTTMPQPEAKKRLFVDDDVLCNLFERLAGTQEPAKVNFRFVLGLILMRKRLLIYEYTLQDGSVNPPRELWVMHFKGREESLDLVNPHLTEAQVQDVSKQLGEILNEEL
jgi:hypothetical protein